MQKWIMGIDGGGTKTIAYASDRKGAIIGNIVAGPSNYQTVGIEQVIHTVYTILGQFLSLYGLDIEGLESVCIGLAGADRPNDRQKVFDAVTAILPYCNLQVYTDAHIALVAGLGRPVGIILISGTGSIAYGINDKGQTIRAGGWGHLVSDEGSGYDIARQGLVQAFRSHEKREQPTKLLYNLLTHLQLCHLDDLVGFLYSTDTTKGDIAALAEVVIRTAEQGDKVANKILEHAGRSLSELVLSVIERGFKTNAMIEVAAYGSIIRNAAILQHHVQVALQGKARLNIPQNEPAIGALTLAQQHMKLGE